MNPIRAFVRLVTNADAIEGAARELEEAQKRFQIAQQQGYWAGFIAGRKQALTDLECSLACQQRAIEDVNEEDIQAVKRSLVH